MKAVNELRSCGASGVAGAACWLVALCAGVGAQDAHDQRDAARTVDTKSTAVHAEEAPAERDDDDIPRVSLEVARDRAKLMQEMLLVTHEVIHRKYFHGDRAAVPARAMEDVFATMQRRSHVEARWFAVNIKPMSINHQAKTDFEKNAARLLSRSDDDVEAVEDGYYRRAVRIPLAGGCLTCHESLFGSRSSTARFAGLVVAIPVEADARLDDADATPTNDRDAASVDESSLRGGK